MFKASDQTIKQTQIMYLLRAGQEGQSKPFLAEGLLDWEAPSMYWKSMTNEVNLLLLFILLALY